MKLSKQLTTVTPLLKYLALSLFIILPLITFAIGYHVGRIPRASTVSYVQQKQISASPSHVNELNPTPTPLPTLKFTHEFIIKELGVKIKVPEEVANDLVYKYENNTVYFSTKSLTRADPACGTSGSPLGAYGKVDKNSPRSEITKKLAQSRIDEGYSDTVVNPTAKEFDNFYIEYAGPQALCSTSSEVGKLISSSRYFFSVGGILASMEPLK
jgi:hypothetical protein